jgi:hypothetical protein
MIIGFGQPDGNQGILGWKGVQRVPNLGAVPNIVVKRFIVRSQRINFQCFHNLAQGISFTEFNIVVDRIRQSGLGLGLYEKKQADSECKYS